MDGYMNAGAFSMSSSEPTRLRAQRGTTRVRELGEVFVLNALGTNWQDT